MDPTFRWQWYPALVLTTGMVSGIGFGLTDLLGNRFLSTGLSSLAVLSFSEQFLRGLWPALGASALVLFPTLFVSYITQRKGKRSRWAVPITLSVSLALCAGIVLNRLFFFKYWFTRSPRIGFLPQALVQPKVILPNLAVVLAAAVLFFILRARSRKPVRVSERSRLPMLVVTTVILATLGTKLATVLAGPEAPSGAPNMIVVSFDTLRADRLGAYGNSLARTPTLDRLAERSTLWSGAVTPAPTTLPAHTALLTSKIPRSIGVLRNSYRVPRSAVTLAEILRNHGYRTAGFVGGMVLGSSFGIAQSFEHYSQEFDRQAHGKQDGYKMQVGYRRAAAVNEKVLEWLGSGPEHPVFLFVHYYDPHMPFDPPPPYDRLFNRHPTSRVTGSFSDIGTLRRQILKSGKPESDSLRLLELYDGEISYADHELGRLFQRMAEFNYMESSTIVFVSDHGETFWDHSADLFNHGLCVYQSTLHVPLMIQKPAASPSDGTIRLDSASLIDVVPTLMALGKLDFQGDFDGHNLLPSSGSALGSRGIVFSESTEAVQAVARRQLTGEWTRRPDARTVITDRFKYSETPYRKGLEELYDLHGDPGEQKNLIEDSVPLPRYEQIYSDLRDALRHWVDKTETDPAFRQEETRDEETLEKLKALGYL